MHEKAGLMPAFSRLRPCLGSARHSPIVVSMFVGVDHKATAFVNVLQLREQVPFIPVVVHARSPSSHRRSLNAREDAGGLPEVAPKSESHTKMPPQG